MKEACLISAVRKINRSGYTSEFDEIISELENLGEKPVKLIIDPLKVPWNDTLEENHFRSGCAPIQALARAREIIQNDIARVVVIEGDDPLKTGYERDERHKLMNIYGDDYTLPEAYTDVARAFIIRNAITETEFKRLAGLLFENYQRTFRRTNPALDLDDMWFKPITPLFRGVDCANPLIDFSGKLLICDKSLAEQVGITNDKMVRIDGIGLGYTGDGRENASSIAAYDHLKEAYSIACEQADIDFAAEYRVGKALLETYTCYPVVPMAFLLMSGIASSADHIPVILSQYEVTVTGGMNLARAPWNNPALNALITVYHLLREGSAKIAAVHGNGGMGFSQGVAILRVFRT